MTARSILVATDLSARSDRAVDRAVRLAGQWAARLILFHSIEPGSRLERFPGQEDAAMRAVLPDPDADVTILPAMGPAPALIVQAANDGNCALIVTGVARFNHAGDYFVGTAVEHVLRHAKAPVLVVKMRPHNDYRSIVIATDFSPCSQKALLTAATLFPDARLHLLHAYHVPYEGWLKSDGVHEEIASEAREDMQSFLNAEEIPEAVRARVSVHLGYGETQTVVLDSIARLGADLLVLGKTGRTGFIPARFGSMAEALLRCSPADTLMVPGAG